MKIVEDISVNTLIAQKQSQSNSFLGSKFSSFLDQSQDESNSDTNEGSNTSLNMQEQQLQNIAYLNKMALGIAV